MMDYIRHAPDVCFFLGLAVMTSGQDEEDNSIIYISLLERQSWKILSGKVLAAPKFITFTPRLAVDLAAT